MTKSIDNPDGILPGQERGPRMNPDTGLWEVDEATAMKGGRWVSADDIERMAGELVSRATGEPFRPVHMVDAFPTILAALPPAGELGALIHKFECFIDHATGGKLSKSSWALETLKAAHDEHLNSYVDSALAERSAISVAHPVEVLSPACPECGGSGEVMFWSDGGPDAYEEPGECPHCKGAQTLEAAYAGVVDLLKREMDKYHEAAAILFLGRADRKASDRLTEIAEYLKLPGAQMNWAHDRLLALADMAKAAAPTGSESGDAGSELHEAARHFHNLTQGDPAVIIRPPSAEKRDAIVAAGERLRAALQSAKGGASHG